MYGHTLCFVYVMSNFNAVFNKLYLSGGRLFLLISLDAHFRSRVFVAVSRDLFSQPPVPGVLSHRRFRPYLFCQRLLVFRPTFCILMTTVSRLVFDILRCSVLVYCMCMISACLTRFCSTGCLLNNMALYCCVQLRCERVRQMYDIFNKHYIV